MSEILWGLLGLVVSIAWAEFTEWTPWLAKRILNATIKKLPQSQQVRVLEELSGVLDETPGKLWKLCRASSLWWGFSREQLRKRFHEGFLEATLRSIDLIFALLFSILFFPLCVVIYILIRLTSGGPGLVSYERIGKNGKIFKLYMFHIMKPDSDKIICEYLRANKDELIQLERFGYLKYDPRITPLGRFLSKSTLHLFPQFFNLLKGDLSLIGHRACTENQQDIYRTHWETYCKVKPGLIRVWQFSRNRLLSKAQRVELEIDYIKNRSLWKTIVILARNMKK